MKLERFSNVIEVEKTDSTNSYLKKYSKRTDHGTVLFADEQSDGRGRLGRSWYGEKGKSIFCSFLIRDIYDNYDAVRLSFMFSMAVKMMLLKYIDNSKIVLKWPNDIMVSDKKICGILSEYSKECVVVGIGINVLHFNPRGEISYPFTTIEAESSITPDISNVKKELVESVNQVFNRYCTNSLNEIPLIWFREADIKNRRITVNTENKATNGKIDSIDDRGSLVITNDLNGEKETIFYGDVTYND
jgi:BirA family biotin operon repressor/biotin-[acetyl-CoA-carboxylase] ligase